MNRTGILKIFFDTEQNKSIVVYTSMEVKKPHEDNFQQAFFNKDYRPMMFTFDPNHPTKIGDSKNSVKFQKTNRATTTLDEVQRLTRDTTAGTLYLTVKALDDDVYGRIRLNTDVTLEDIQRFFQRDDGNDINHKLDELRDKYGIRSGIMQQLAAMIGDSRTMKKLTELQRMKAKANDPGSKKVLIYGSSSRDFVEENKSFKSVERRRQEKLEKNIEAHQRRAKVKDQNYDRFIDKIEKKKISANRSVIKRIMKYNEAVQNL